MGRISFNEQGNIKRVKINNPIRTFIIIFSVLFIIMYAIMWISGVKIEPGPLEGLSQTTLYLVVILILLIVNLFFFSPKIEFISDSNQLILKRTNFLYITNIYYFGKNDKIYLVGKKKFSVVGTKDEGIVRAYKPFLRLSNQGKETNIKLFPWIGLLYIQSLDWDNTFSLTKLELDKIASFLGIKLIVE